VQVLRIVPEPGGEVCDFCTSRPIFKSYSCRNFLVPWTKHWIHKPESDAEWNEWMRLLRP
jgi:hypothetical protein